MTHYRNTPTNYQLELQLCPDERSEAHLVECLVIVLVHGSSPLIVNKNFFCV